MCENFEDSNKGSTETIALKLLGRLLYNNLLVYTSDLLVLQLNLTKLYFYRITDESSTCIFGEEVCKLYKQYV